MTALSNALPRQTAKVIGEALGIRDCCRLTISRAHDGPVTIEAEFFARDNFANALTGDTATRRMVLVDADEYARLKQLDAGDPRRQMTELVVRGGASLDEARAAFGLPPVDPQEATA